MEKIKLNDGERVDVLVYKNEEDYKANMGNHEAMFDFMPVHHTFRHPETLKKGRVWDLFIYDEQSNLDRNVKYVVE